MANDSEDWTRKTPNKVEVGLGRELELEQTQTHRRLMHEKSNKKHAFYWAACFSVFNKRIDRHSSKTTDFDHTSAICFGQQQNLVGHGH